MRLTGIQKFRCWNSAITPSHASMESAPTSPLCNPASSAGSAAARGGGVAASINSAYTDGLAQSKTNPMRRIAITGIGAVSPNGIGREQFWESTRKGVSGVRRITRFDTSGYQVQVAGEVPPEFDEKQYVEVKDRPHVSRAVPLAAASVAEALVDAGLESDGMSRDELRGIGVLVGSGGGSQDFTEEQYRLFYAGLIKQCS